VRVSSVGQAPVDFDDVMLERDCDGVRAYCQSKLAQVMFTIDLAEELHGTRGRTPRPTTPRRGAGCVTCPTSSPGLRPAGSAECGVALTGSAISTTVALLSTPGGRVSARPARGAEGATLPGTSQAPMTARARQLWKAGG
jgi:hypothetical protein